MENLHIVLDNIEDAPERGEERGELINRLKAEL